MSDKKGRIEFGRSGEFKIKITDGDGVRYEDFFISAGKHYSCEKIFHWSDGYSDVYLGDGRVLEKISLNDLTYSCAFGEHGHVEYENEENRDEGDYPVPHSEEEEEEKATEAEEDSSEDGTSEKNEKRGWF